MQTSIDISWLQLGLFSLLLFIPIVINAHFKLGINKSTVIALVRLFLQLLLVGFYLEYIFELDSILLNTGWLIVMITVGSYSIITKSGLNNRYLFIANSIALSCAVLPILLVLSLLIIQPAPWYSAQYMIPLAGMLLGNSLSANIVALQHLFGAFKQQQDQAEILKEHKRQCKYPVIICGDMNNSAFSYVYRSIKGNLKDSFEEAGVGFGKTYKFKYYPARIDYIFVDQSINVKTFESFSNFENSDHYPIMAKISID